MKNLNVYKTINSIPENANIISSRWIFKYKKNAQGQITKRKSRLVVNSLVSIIKIHTFSPTLKQDSISIH